MKNEYRSISTKEEVIGNKRINDIIYGFYQANSYLNEDKVRFCYKTDCTAEKIIAYFKEQEKECPVSVRTIREVNKLLINAGLFKEGEIKGLDGKIKKAYILPDLNSHFVQIKTETLRYLVNTANTNVIKVYAYLKARHSMKHGYEFSKRELLEAIGYVYKTDNLKIITDVLNCLVNNELIEIHTIKTDTGNGNATFYYILDKVNEDYKVSIPSRQKKDETIVAIPVVKTFAEFKF